MMSVDANEVASVQEISTRNEELYPFCKEKSIVNALIARDEGAIEIQTKIKENTYGVTVLPNRFDAEYRKLVIDLPRKCSKMAKSSTHRPNVGDLICGQRADGDWFRGYIVCNQPTMRMAMIEEAKIEPINKITTCDKMFSDIYAFGAICEVTDFQHKFETDDMYEFKVARRRHGEVEIIVSYLMSTSPERSKATLKPWIPMPEQIGLLYTELENESEVRISGYQNHVHLFLRHLDTTTEEHFNHVVQSVTECAQTAPYWREVPPVGEMVLAYFGIEKYCRGIVMKILYDFAVTLCVDFGSTRFEHVKKLRVLPDNLKQLRACVTPVMLKDVPKKFSITDEVNEYLTEIVENEVPLLCTFNGNPSIDGVHLKSREGESISEIITKLFEPIFYKAANKIAK